MSDKNESFCKMCCEVEATLIWKPTFKMYSNMPMEAYKVCEYCFEMLKAEEESEKLANKIKCDGADVDSLEYSKAQIEAELNSIRRAFE